MGKKNIVTMKKTIFTGAATAIVTPMTATGIDYEALGRFIEFQIENGINAIVVMGTTGENATIEHDEQTRVIAYVVEKVAKLYVAEEKFRRQYIHKLHHKQEDKK